MRHSISKVFTGMFGWDNKVETPTEALKDGLKTVSRILYAAGGLHDKRLSVAYSDKNSANMLSKNIVYLDSDVVLSGRKGYQTYDLRNDVLIGAALVGANAKLTANADYYEDLRENDEDIKRVYESTEFRASEMRVETEAPGLVEYLDARADYYAAPELMEQLQECASMEETHSSVACALLNNLLVHRSLADSVNMGVYNDVVNEAFGRLERCTDSRTRHEEAINVVNWFRETFDQEPEPEPEPEDNEDDKEPEDQEQCQDCQDSGKDKTEKDNDTDKEDEGEGNNDTDKEAEGEGNNDTDKEAEGEGNNNTDSDGKSDGEPKNDSNENGESSSQDNSSESNKQDGNSEDSNGTNQPAKAKPDLSEWNQQIAKEFTMISGDVNPDTGDCKAVRALRAPQPGDAGEEPGSVEIGEEQPCNGWGDEVEPASLRVDKIPDSNIEKYNSIKAEVLVGIRALVNKLSWTTQKPAMTEHGYRSGDLDEGSLSNLFISDDFPAVFQRTEVFNRPEVAVGIMVDESGSMHGPKIIAARKTAIMLSEAFRQISGTRVRVWGHTTEPHWDVNECLVIPYMTHEHQKPYSLAALDARSGNIDGAALWYAAQELAKHDNDAERRILFCISDGLPSGGQEDGVAYNRRKAEAARQIGVEVFGIGIQNAYTPEVGEALFGKDAFCIFPDVESAGQVIGAFITRTVNKM